jgi:predicted RNA-binding protein
MLWLGIDLSLPNFLYGQEILMARKYWLDLFTGETWEEFLNNSAKVSGFRERRKKIAQTIDPGDYLICYMTGISRFIGVLEVK